MRDIELHAACRQYLALKESESAQAHELHEAGEAEKVADAHAARLEAGLSAERLQLLEDEKKVQELAEHSHRIDKQLRLLEQEQQFAQREREAIAARQVQYGEELSLLGVRLELLGREEEGLRVEQQKLSDASAEDQARQKQAEEALEKAFKEIHDAQHGVEAERHEAVSVLTRLANHRTNLVNLERRRTDLGARLAKTQTEKEQLEARAQEIARQRDELAQKLIEAQEKRRALHDLKTATEEELARGRAEQRETEAALIKLREELADRRSRLTSLLELQKNFEGYGRGVKAVMLREEEERRRDGIYGLVADVLHVEPRHERAVEAVLGDRLQLILVESHAAGLKAVDYLKRASAGRASFVPLTEMEQLPLTPEGARLAAPEGTLRAVEVVDCAPEHERLRNYLLNDVFLCDSLATALLLWARNPGERTFVSADGEVVDKEGIVSGGQLDGVADGLLHKRREVQELAETVQDLEAKLHLLSQQVQLLAARVQTADTTVKRLVHEEREEELSQLRLERDVARLQEELSRIAQRDQVLLQETESLQNALGEVTREEQSSRDAVAAGEGEQSEREARLRALQAELLKARERAEAVQAEVTRAKVSAAAVAERREGLARSLQRLQEQRSEVEARREKLSAEIAAGKERDAALLAKSEVAQSELKQLLADSERLREELGRARAQYDQAQQRLSGGDEDVRKAREEAKGIGERRNKAELAVQGTRLEITHLEQSVRERNLMELADVAAAKRDEALQLDLPAAEEKMRALREQIDALGEVSLTAIDEAREVGERYTFLTAQKADLEEGSRSCARRSGASTRPRRSASRRRSTLVNDKLPAGLPAALPRRHGGAAAGGRSGRRRAGHGDHRAAARQEADQRGSLVGRREGAHRGQR